MSDAVIVSAARLPTGRFLGQLSGLSAPELGAFAVKEAVARAGLEPSLIEECVLGNVVSAGLGQNPARQAALGGGLPPEVGCLTINKVCGSGLKAVMLAAQAIAAGDIQIAVAGGMESMSNCPHLIRDLRRGRRLGHTRALDAMVVDGLWCPFEDWHMGMSGEAVAERYGISRREQDDYAVLSHQRAARATDEGWFEDEIVPVTVPQAKGDPLVVTRDESIRPSTSSEALAALSPAFTPTGTVTAGNAPGTNDGAAAVVVVERRRAEALGLEPMASIVGQATSGLAPKWVMMTPVEAVRKLVARVGWRLEDVDLFELNEAFAVQAIAVTREHGLDLERDNVHGGAVALGHPIGASGARILVTLLHAMRRRGARRGIATLCLGGGNGVALAVERP